MATRYSSIETDLRPIPAITVDVQCRFWLYVDRKSEEECWNWIGYKNQDGYGRFSIRGSPYYTNRVSYKLHVCEPTYLLVCHECNNPACVNPAHLYLGTDSDNSKYIFFSGRRNMRGSNNVNAVLDEREVVIIRQLLRSNTQQIIADKFGVTRALISQIHRGVAWTHV